MSDRAAGPNPAAQAPVPPKPADSPESILERIVGVDNPSPHLVLAVAIILMLLPVVINLISIQVAARVNNIAVFTEIIGTVVFGVLLLVLWGVKSKPTPYGAGILTSTTSVFHNPTWYA
jgi:amino acid transporter